jgi:hypothetical protein
MTISKASDVKRGTTARSLTKASVRYIQRRRGRGGGRLFGSDGLTDKHAVYSLIDASRRGTVLYTCILSPDPAKEDTDKDLDVEHITRQTIHALEEHFDQAGKEANTA